MWKCKNPKCGKVFHIAARISTEKLMPRGQFDIKRVIVEKACCPFCESIEFEEVKS